MGGCLFQKKIIGCTEKICLLIYEEIFFCLFSKKLLSNNTVRERSICDQFMLVIKILMRSPVIREKIIFCLIANNKLFVKNTEQNELSEG